MADIQPEQYADPFAPAEQYHAAARAQYQPLKDAEIDAILHAVQPSITDRDPGDESRSVDRLIIGELRDYQGELSAEIVIGRARIAALEAEIARLHQAHEQYVAAQRVLTKNACDWRDAEIAKLRADLDRLMATPPAPSTAPTPPPRDPIANALTARFRGGIPNGLEAG